MTFDISEGGAAMESACDVSAGDTLTLHLEYLGDLDAMVARVFSGGFAVAFALAPERQTRVADQLRALWIRSPMSLIEISLEGADPADLTV